MADYAQMIASMLAKAEGTDSEAEAETFRAKAYELMTKHSIDQAVIEAKHGIYKDAMLRMSHNIVCALPTVKSYVEKNVNVNWEDLTKPKVKGHIYTIVGFESDVKQAELLLVSLQLQAASALTTWWKTDTHAMVIQETGTPMEKFKARREFVMAFGRGAATRLTQRFNAVVKERGVGTEVMLQDRGSQIEAWLKENMDLTTSKGRGLAAGDARAAASGYVAGTEANTGETKIGPDRTAIGS